jgi:predicted protein tyrosine phosphatase
MEITDDPFLMNRLGNCHNSFQDHHKHKRVVCVCSAGLLRSPTAALVLSQEPWNYNTRAVGLIPEFALVPLDRVLLEWGQEFVCMTKEHAEGVQAMLHKYGMIKPIVVLNVPDQFSYRNTELVKMIGDRYLRHMETKLAGS